MMANLTDTAASWEAGVYQIETTDPVVGGAPNPTTGAGMSNIPHLQLAKRTTWLKGQVEALQNAGGYKSALTFTGNQTLTAADAGKCYIYGETTAVTLTLPTIADTPVGSIFEFINTGTANMTVQRAGSDQIDSGPSAVASIVIPPNQSLKLIRATGSSLWHPVSVTAALGALGLPTSGAVMYFAMNTAPSGWLKANGAAVSRIIYADLFTAIGTTFGAGNGSTTFNLPDLRGEFLRGWDDGRGVDASRMFGSFQDATSFTDFRINSDGRIDYKNTDGTDGTVSGNFIASGAAQTATYRKTRPRNIALLACIKF